ncbi:MAG TPA: PAS domain-containing sensor histidine kinase [Planctomycetota bacterium]|nr:PAS domain-containing sensor histidine kinase [Planctomycetota bacterium]
MKTQLSKDPAALRRAAEARLKVKPATPPPYTEADMRRLLRELEVRQIELEIQNKELHAAQAQIEAGRKRAEAALRESEERHRSILQTAMDGFWLVDSQGRLLEVNETYCGMSGYGAQELLSMRISDLEYCETAADIASHIQKIMAQGQDRFESRHRRKDGGIFDVEISVHYRSTDSGRIVVFLRDITERKQSEQNLRQSEKQMRALAARLQSIREEERTQIAREIHDVLAQELTLLKFDIVWSSRRLAQAVDETTRAALAGKLHGISSRTNSVISTVQKIATDLRPVVLDSLGLFAAVEWQAEDFVKRTGIACRALVPAAEPLVGHDQATAVFRILQESLTNVIRHAQATEADVELAVKDGQLTLTVCDNGCGITPEKLSDMHSIGLAGMRERALVFGGRVEITGAPGAGTTVMVRMPLIRAAEVSRP